MVEGSRADPGWETVFVDSPQENILLCAENFPEGQFLETTHHAPVLAVKVRQHERRGT